MARRSRPKVSLQRFLVSASELAIEVEARASDFARATGGTITAQSAAELHALIAEIRVLGVQRRGAPGPTPTVAATHAVAELARLRAVAEQWAKLQGDTAMRTRLAELRRDHPLRARAVSVIACSIEAYAGFVSKHAQQLSSFVGADYATTLEARARELRAASSRRRLDALAARELTAQRNALLATIEGLCRAIRAAERLLLTWAGGHVEPSS